MYMSYETTIENRFIKKLEALKYTYRQDIRNIEALHNNFRQKFEALNKVNLSDNEFSRLMEMIITPNVFKNAQTLRQMNSFIRDDGTPLNYTLVNIKDWCKNEFEVINQPRVNHDDSYHRYDVVILINGLPIAQTELKTYVVSPRRAMQQIVDYKKDVGNGYTNTLMCFMQLFIVSNNNKTYYFANNDNRHFAFDADERFLPVYEYADRENKKISGLDDFCETFLEKCTLGETVSRYMVLVASEQKMLMMRPYQVYAVKAIVDCIHQNRGNGYIWHTTGSGKTLTSFKASTLLKDNPDIEKCLFVVDRKDLDRQTREEFNKFQEGAVEENTNTHALVERLLSDDYADKVIVTTIQKLGLALDGSNKNDYKKRLQPLADKRVVFIFDECHRSQFGDNHKAIKEFFPNAQLFGFTGTPIFEENSNYVQIEGKVGQFKTTEDIFEKQLHAYTITHAIEDKNVLSFHVDYFKPENSEKEKAAPSNNQDVLAKEAIVNAILDKHDTATDHRRFNALFATASINDAITYYELFKKVQAQRLDAPNEWRPLNIACVFSPPSEGNNDVRQLQEDLAQEKEDNKHNPEGKKQALTAIIADYNAQFDSNHQISQFDQYYQDVQQRIKDHKYPNSDYAHGNKIDITIVVDMLLTGFDSQYLNTLYVDKNLKYHGLIQAFSRTNRVLNDTKPWGNILDFRHQETAVNDAIELFSGEKKDHESAREIWLVDPAPKVISDYKEKVGKLEQFMASQGLDCTPQAVANLKGDKARANFINDFKAVQRLKTQLDQYTDLTDEQTQAIADIIPKEDLLGFRGVYIDIAKDLKAKQDKPESTDADDSIDELDFEFVLFSSAIIDYDYIMGLISRYTQEASDKHKMSKQELIDLLASQSNLMDERDIIADYINSLQAGEPLSEAQIKQGYNDFKAKRSAKELDNIASKHGLDSETLSAFVDEIIWRKVFDGEALTELLKPLNLGWKARMSAEMALMDELIPLLKKRADGQEISGLKAYED